MKLDVRQKLLVVMALELAIERTSHPDDRDVVHCGRCGWGSTVSRVPTREHLERVVDELDLSDVFVVE